MRIQNILLVALPLGLLVYLLTRKKNGEVYPPQLHSSSTPPQAIKGGLHIASAPPQAIKGGWLGRTPPDPTTGKCPPGQMSQVMGKWKGAPVECVPAPPGFEKQMAWLSKKGGK